MKWSGEDVITRLNQLNSELKENTQWLEIAIEWGDKEIKKAVIRNGLVDLTTTINATKTGVYYKPRRNPQGKILGDTFEFFCWDKPQRPFTTKQISNDYPDVYTKIEEAKQKSLNASKTIVDLNKEWDSLLLEATKVFTLTIKDIEVTLDLLVEKIQIKEKVWFDQNLYLIDFLFLKLGNL